MALEKPDFNAVLDKVDRLPMPARLAVFGLVFVAVVAMYWFSWYSGELAEARTLRAQLTSIQAEISQSRAVVANLDSFMERREHLQVRLDEALRRLPNQRELPELLTNITGIGKKSGLEFRSFTPQAEVSREFYAEVPIRIEVQGSYHDVAVFFDRLSRHDRIVNVGDISLSVVKESGTSPLLNLTGTATTFRFKGNGGSRAGGE